MKSFLTIIAAFLAQAIQINRMGDAAEGRAVGSRMHSFGPRCATRYRFENIIGDSPAMHEVFATVGQLANSTGRRCFCWGDGHGQGDDRQGDSLQQPAAGNPFVRVNCGALTGTLLESELFGHVKGSFTGAIRDKIGRI